jgi:chorismate mutase / prephenate dehydratase
MPISRIACLGPEGTFSHLLAAQRFGTGVLLEPCDSLDRVFSCLEEDGNSLAVVPIENSSGGTITETIDLLIQFQSVIEVREDLTLDVRLALLGHRNKPIREIYSHFAPLSHHRDWLRQEFPGARLVPVASTAVAARHAVARPTRAALASPGVAQLLPLDVLQFPIRADEVNITRFYVLSPRGGRIIPRGKGPKKTAMDKTALVVQLKNECGSLHAFLGVFARKQINLRLIVSRPVPGHPETYVFYLEVEGHAERDPLAQALRLARRHCLSLESLGAFQVGRRFSS